MKLLHTSDWHLGRSLCGHARLDEQVAVLEQLVEVARAERVDVVVVAGDVYDRQLPAVDAVRALGHLLRELWATGARVVAISGNHDSPARLGFVDALLTEVGVTLRGHPTGGPVVVPTTDGGPDLVVYPVPYLEPEVARHELGAPDARTHAAVLDVAVAGAHADRASRGPHRSVLVAHAFVSGGLESESERLLTVGGTAQVPAATLAGFDYVALGHLHAPQELGDGPAGASTVRYSGAPLAYAFSERSQDKSAWLVDLPPAGRPRVEAVPLTAPRTLAVVEGTLDDLLHDAALSAHEGAWVHAVVTDGAPLRDAMARLRGRFPHAVSLEHRPASRLVGAVGPGARQVRGRTDLELAEAFLEHVRGDGPDPRERDLLVQVLDEARRSA